MPSYNSKESVTVTFHFFEKGDLGESGDFLTTPFDQSDFDALAAKISEQPAVDPNDPDDFDRLKFGRLVPYLNVERANNRTLFGQFKSAYWGHSFDNTEKGKISASSLNLREFCFLLYLAENGRIYLGCQYLGHYGDYTSLNKSINSKLNLGNKVRSHSIRSDMEDFRNMIPQEVRISLFSSGKTITSTSAFSKGSMVAFRKGRKDDNFEISVKDRLLSIIGQPHPVIKKQIATMLNENEHYSVLDDDIENCVVTVRKIKSKSTRSIYMFGNNARATHFHMNVNLNDDGLPKLTSAREKMIEKLNEEIISKNE